MSNKFLMRSIFLFVVIPAAIVVTYLVLAKRSSPVVPVTVPSAPANSTQAQVSGSLPTPPAENGDVAEPPVPVSSNVQFGQEFKLGQGQVARISDSVVTLDSLYSAGSVDVAHVTFQCKNLQPSQFILSVGKSVSKKPDCVVELTFVRTEKNQAVFITRGIK